MMKCYIKCGELISKIKCIRKDGINLDLYFFSQHF